MAGNYQAKFPRLARRRLLKAAARRAEREEAKSGEEKFFASLRPVHSPELQKFLDSLKEVA